MLLQRPAPCFSDGHTSLFHRQHLAGGHRLMLLTLKRISARGHCVLRPIPQEEKASLRPPSHLPAVTVGRWKSPCHISSQLA